MVCTDDRQHVRLSGQAWTTNDDLSITHRNRIELDGDLIGIGVAGVAGDGPPARGDVEAFGIPQRALLVRSDVGNVLWDCVGLVTADAIREVGDLGGIDAIAISHPHFYSSMIEWSDAFGGVPVHLHRADETWIQRRSEAVELWDGDELRLSPTVRLLHLPGHFPGSSALFWSAAPNGRSVLLAGDSLHVAGDRAHITVMHSVPNHIPVGPAVISDLRTRLAGIEFDDLYGFTWGLNIIGGARRAVAESLDRYMAAITDSVGAA